MMDGIAEYALAFINNSVLTQMKNRKEFRSRARDLYSASYFEGLIPTIVFAYAKATEKNIIELLKGNNMLNGNEEGYGFYVVALIKFLKDYLKISSIDGSIDKLIEVLNEKSIENKVLIYMRWLKYFAEAKIVDKEGV